MQVAFHAALARTFTLRFLVNRTAMVAAVVGAAFLAIRISGIEPLFAVFLDAHGGLLIKTLSLYVAMYIFLWPLCYVASRFLSSLLEGFSLAKN